MMDPSILFATPMYGGQCTEPFFASAMRVSAELDRAGLAHDWLSEKNESLVHRARMEMAATFLRSDHTHLFFIDADIEFTPQDVSKIWNLQADIGVGVYAMKKPDKQWFAAWKDGALVTNLDQFSGPIEVDYAGTGFMLISRTAVDEVIAYLKKRHEIVMALVGDTVVSDVAPEIVDAFAHDWEGANGRVPALFMTPIYQDGLESEDYNFCRVARQAGLKIIMDPSVRLRHYGQYAYGA